MAMPFVQDLRSSAGTNITWVQSIHTVQEKPAWHWWLQGIIGPLCDGVVTPSAAILQKLRQYGPVPRGRVIGNGIQVRRFFEARVVADVPWPPGKKIVGYIGRFDPVKRLGLLIEAIARLPEEYQLALVGYGQEEQRLRGLVKRLYLERRVHFTGATTEPERWYKAFDVFCLPSAAEGFPLSLAEAVSAGVPVVACDTPAVRETVPEAVWVKAEVEVNELAQALVQGAGQPPNRISLSELEKRYSVERMVQGYEGYFQSLRGSRA
jgi:glycosyltransferase involved in cell wall biosynthesis